MKTIKKDKIQLGGYEFSGHTMQCDVTSISENLEFQCRCESDTAIRAKEIADSVLQTESTCFDDIMIVWYDEFGALCIVSGFARRLAACMLGWGQLQVFCLDSSYDQNDIKVISTLGNAGNKPCRPLSDKELTQKLVDLYECGDLKGLDKIREAFNLTESSVKARINNFLKNKLLANGSETSLPRRFRNTSVAHGAGRRVIENLTGEKFGSLKEAIKYMESEHGILCRGTIWAGKAEPLLDWAKAKHSGEEIRVLSLVWGTSGQHALPGDTSVLDTITEITGGEVLSIPVYPNRTDRTQPQYDMIRLQNWFEGVAE